MKLNLPRLFISFGITFAAAALGSAFTASAIATWYAKLPKPPLNPPNWVFGPVWTVLYILMALALYRFWVASSGRSRTVGLALYAAQIILNALWSIVFFGLRQPGAAVIVIFFLWATLVRLIPLYRKEDTLAGLFLVPYVLWVSFAAYLNVGVVLLAS